MNAVPEGYMQDAAGRLVPTDRVDPIDIERNDLVIEAVKQAKALSTSLTKFKVDVDSNVSALIELSADQYGIKMGGKKGNVSINSFDGRYRLQRAIAENIDFDERLQVAKELIDQCVHRWANGIDSNIRALVEHAFQVSKSGEISKTRILSLRSIKIEDEQWLQAMEAIADSLRVSGSTSYIRLYERVGETDRYEAISLDIAKL